MVLESSIVEKITDFLDEQGAYWVKNHGSIYTRVGVADLHICRDGKFIALEVKRPGEEPTAKQIRESEKVEASGGISRWTDSFADFRAWWLAGCPRNASTMAHGGKNEDDACIESAGG